MTRVAAAAVAVLAAGVVLPACGGEDEEPAVPSRPPGAAARKAPARSGKALTKPVFLREADAACAEAKRRAAPITAVVNAKIANEDAAGVAAELRKALPIADELLGRLTALPPPKRDEPIVGRYLDIVAEQKGRIPPLIEALDAEDISGIEVLAAELREGNQRAERLARGYGFTKCVPGDLPIR